MSVSGMTSKLMDEFSLNCHHRSQVKEGPIKLLGPVERISPPLMYVKIKDIRQIPAKYLEVVGCTIGEEIMKFRTQQIAYVHHSKGLLKKHLNGITE